MQVKTSSERECLVAVVSGRFDAHSINEFEKSVLNEINADHKHVIIDLADVEFMDSSALAALVRALKATVSLGGSVILVNVSNAVRIILELTRLDAVFVSAPTLDEARTAIFAGA